MKIDLGSYVQSENINITVRCPHCGNNGVFLSLGLADIRAENHYNDKLTKYIGIRKCPNKSCNGQLFFITDNAGKILLTSPSETIPFEKDNIPEKVLNAFKEAIKCHSNSCFIASAIMIRKTLEEICINRGASGSNLLKKLEDLGSKIIIPKELIEGMNELRLLGNDAAHIEAKTFSEIGKEEIEVSLEFAKEILKAVYQYETFLSRLKGLKTKKAK